MSPPPRWDDVAVGDAAEPRAVGPLAVRDFVRYAGASGDFNALHYDEAYARAAGFPSVFAQGMFDAGVLASYAAAWLGPAGVRRFHARFEEVVWPGDTVTCKGEIVRKYEESGERRVDVVLQCARQTGEVAVRGEATFALD